MDYILNRINNNIELSEVGSYEHITSLRKRIEYCLFVLVGYLWNKNAEDLLISDRQRIILSFNQMTIGDIVSAITTLDIHKEIFRIKKSKEIICKYPSLRNTKIGHGYTESSGLIKPLEELYEDLYEKIPFLQKQYSLVVVEKKESQNYLGIRIDCNSFGRAQRWGCPAEIFPDEDGFPRTYALIDNSYYKLSPFISIFRHSTIINEYAFSSLNDSLLGQIKLCPLFGDTGDIQYVYDEFARFSDEDEYREISPNGTVMNRFDCNYNKYLDVGFSRIVTDFLCKNKSNVSATLWGHGGVGKTACIQNVCQQLFCGRDIVFTHIIFVTAKDRIFNPASGTIVLNTSKYVRQYAEIIETIIQTVFPSMASNFDLGSLSEAEKQIQEYPGKLLIIIDDYETFLESEKQKIANFIKSLDINHHKVIITTRNIRLAIGTAIPTNELSQQATCDFLRGIITEKCQELLPRLDAELAKGKNAEKLHQATNGRPIFICQFAYLYMQKGICNDIFVPLINSENARDFLYGRVYDYLTENAKLVFSIIPTIVNEDLLFRFDMLNYILQKELPDEEKIEAAIEELVGQLIIERYSDTQGRVYAPELLTAMRSRYAQFPEPKKEATRRLIESIGGKEVSCSIEEAMLHEADQSRVTGNTVEIVGKYRRVLNLKKCDSLIRKQALINVSSYLNTTELNPKAASEILKEYWSYFKDDEQIAYIYVVYLWQQEDCKAETISFLKNFFSHANGHKKTSSRYLQLFALATSYCTYYDLSIRKYDSNQKKRVQLSQTINEFGKALFSAAKSNFSNLRPGVRHVTQMGLIQTAKACTVFDSSDMAKVELGLEICQFAALHFNKYSQNLAKSIQDKLEKTYNAVDETQGKKPLTLKKTAIDLPESYPKDTLQVGDLAEGIITSIEPRGILISFGQNQEYVGLARGNKYHCSSGETDAKKILFGHVQIQIIRMNPKEKEIEVRIQRLLNE